MQIGHDELDVRWRAKPSQLNASLDEIFIVALVPNQLFCRRGLSQKPELYIHNRKEECYESLSIVRLGIAEELREQSVVARIKRTVEITRWKRHISDSNRCPIAVSKGVLRGDQDGSLKCQCERQHTVSCEGVDDHTLRSL